jgi:hypothetical protein
MRALVIPADESQPIREVQLEKRGDSCLASLQKLVGGNIEAIAWPEAFEPKGKIQIAPYVNEEGKYTPGCEPNMRATILMRPVLQRGDWIAGDLVLAGIDYSTGETAALPEGFEVMAGGGMVVVKAE